MNKDNLEFIKSIAVLLGEISDENRNLFYEVFKERVNRPKDDNLIIRVYRKLLLSWNGQKELLDGLVDSHVLRVFIREIYKNISKSNISYDGFREIKKVDIEILHWLQNVDCDDCIEYLVKTLIHISNFIGNDIWGTNFNVNNNQGVKGFFTTTYLPDLIFYSTLILYKKGEFKKGQIQPELKALYENRLFQYDVFFRSSSQKDYEETFINGRTVAIILWSLLKDALNFQIQVSVNYKNINNTKGGYVISHLVSGIMGTQENHFSWDAFGKYLNGIEEYSLTYNFLEAVEGINFKNSEPFKKVVATFVSENTRYKEVLIDFTRFFLEYANDKYLERIGTLTKGDFDWFKELIKQNLKSDEQILWEESCKFLLLEPIVDVWCKDKDMLNSIKSFIISKLNNIKIVEELLENETHYLAPLIQKFLEKNNRKMSIPFTPFGNKVHELLEKWLLDQQAQLNIRFIKTLLKYFKRFLGKDDIPTFIEKFETLIEANFSTLNSEKFNDLYYGFLEPLLKPYLKQDFIKKLGRKVIGNQFRKSELKVYVALVKTAGYIKDEFGLKKNIESVLSQENIDSKTKELLNELLGYVK